MRVFAANAPQLKLMKYGVQSMCEDCHFLCSDILFMDS